MKQGTYQIENNDSLRWVSESFQVYEDFIGLVQLSDTTAATVYMSIKDLLLRLGLPMNMCLGLGYDGTSTFMGHLNGVATIFHDEVPETITVHCLLTVSFCVLETHAGNSTAHMMLWTLPRGYKL